MKIADDGHLVLNISDLECQQDHLSDPENGGYKELLACQPTSLTAADFDFHSRIAAGFAWAAGHVVMFSAPGIYIPVKNCATHSGVTEPTRIL